MQLVDQQVEVWGECPSVPFEAKLWIERAGRTCYNSRMSDPPDPDAYIKKLLAPDPPHSAMLEHSNLVLSCGSNIDVDGMKKLMGKYESRWIDISFISNIPVIYGNMRAFMEALNMNDFDDVTAEIKKDGLIWMSPLVTPRELKRVTVKLITDRNVLAEITRHRNDVGFAVRSQRYVDESRDMEFIKPSWWSEMDFIQQQTFILSCEQAELNYRTLRKSMPPQHARTVLTGQCRTVIVMTAYLAQWDWMFKLRRAPGAYPQIIALMDMVYDQFKERGYVENH